MYLSINPYTQETLESYPLVSANELEAILQESNQAQKKWKNQPFSLRASKVKALATIIQEQHEQLAELATLEMGKTYAEAKLEVLKCITACEYYAQNSETILKPTQIIHSDERTVTQQYVPLGIVLGIFPWNFPYWQIIRSAIPIVMAGNSMLVKPAPNTPQCSLALQELFQEVGLGDGIIHSIFANESQIETLLADSRIKACTLTGSEKAGSAVASIAAKHIKKSVLELGGSDPFIVLDDADMDKVMMNAISARFQNNGQSCIAAKRFIVHKNRLPMFIEYLIEAMKNLKMGNPMDSETQIGPLARVDLKIKLQEQLDSTIKQGARLLFQSNNNEQSPCFFPPTLLTDIPTQSTAYTQELFGPILALYSFETDDEAIHLANDTEFGLGASIWSSNPTGAQQMADQLECGQVFINAVTRSNTAFPFGGIKKSGFGRELGEQGLKEFSYLKTTWI